MNVDFHPVLTVLTGANGTGKTTILKLISKHFGWNLPFIASKRKKKSSKGLIFSHGRRRKVENVGATEVGTVTYSDGATAKVMLQNSNAVQSHLSMSITKKVNGIHIPSHRPIPTYRAINSIPSGVLSKTVAYKKYNDIIIQRNQGNYSNPSPPSYLIKEAIVSMLVFGYGNEHVESDIEAREAIEGFQDVLRSVLPKSIGFKRFRVIMPELIMETDTGDFPIDAVSGGVSSIIDMAYQIYMKADTSDRFVVTLDEPENHLHPSLQRELLPNLVSTFRNAQFIITTHSPLVVGSVPESSTYVLDYDDNKRVCSEFLDTNDKSGTANEVLKKVLGLGSTMPIWAEDKINSLIDKYSVVDLNDYNLRMLRSDLENSGMDNLVTSVISQVISRKNND